LSQKEFLQKIDEVISSEYFENPAFKWIVDFTLQYYSKYHTYPTADVLRVELKKEGNEILRVAIREALRQIYSTEEDDIEYVKEEFFKFCQNQKLKQALMFSVDLLKNGQYEDIRRLIDNAMKAGENKNVGLVLSKDIESRYRDEDSPLVEFPYKEFNEATDGGMPEGSLILILGGTGSGKSTTACDIAIDAAKKGHIVAYYTLELSENYVGKKMDSLLTNIEMKQLRFNRERIDKANSNVPGTIIVKEFYPGRSSLDHIESHMRHIKNSMDVVPKLIVIDYPELLKSRKSRNDVNAETNDTYTDIKGMAREWKTRIVCPSQVNRSGMKEDIIEHDGIAGSIGKIFIADFSFSISRKRKDKINRTARFHILKSRLGDDGMTYNVSMDLRTNEIKITGLYDDETDSSTNVSNGGNGYMDSEELDNLKNKFLKIHK
jgi:replicative DNA helicase